MSEYILLVLDMLSEIQQDRVGKTLLTFWIDLAAREADNDGLHSSN